jgi:hypothetical protein
MYEMPGTFFILPIVQWFLIAHAHWKQFLGGICMHSNEEVKKTVKDWFNGLTADLYNAYIQKLVTQYDYCLNLHADYGGEKK